MKKCSVFKKYAIITVCVIQSYIKIEKEFSFVIDKMSIYLHLVLHPYRIAPTFLNLEWWSPGAGFIPIISTKGINQIKKEKFYTYKKILYIFLKYGCNFTSTIMSYEL